MDGKSGLKKYRAVIGYGIGQNYEQMKGFLEGKLAFDYLADKKWEDSGVEEYDGIPIIRLRQLKRMKGILIVLFPRFASVRNVILRELEGVEAKICYVHDIFPTEHCVRSEELAALLPKTEFADDFDNRVVYDGTVPANIRIFFSGRGSVVKIGSNLAVNYLDIYCGNHGDCTIGNRSFVQGAQFYVSGARLQLGEDCLLSHGVRVRTHDHHHIFDRETHKRVNYAKDVVIGDKVWIGQDAVLLAGSNIGDGSIVGERAVTSSAFGKHVVVAGCPAKVIRENICWATDDTSFFNHDRLEECVDGTAFRYTGGDDASNML